MFASRSVFEHLSRGAVGFGAFAVAMSVSSTHAMVSLALLPVAFMALRGCPMCWTVGLFETVVARVRGQQRPDSCVDGRCAR